MPATTTRTGIVMAVASPSSRVQLQEIVAALEEDIIFGRLLPRERLPEDRLIERFAAKRHVVRQALAELGRMGVVMRDRNRGAAVRDFSLQDVEEIYELRALLQARAAGQIPLPGSPELVAALRRIHAGHGRAVEQRELRAVYRLNNDFHNTLFGACGNRHLAEAIAHYAWLAHAIRSYRIADPVLLAQAREEHAAMIEALAAGDRQRLVRLCVEHIRPSKDAWLAARQLAAAALPGQQGEPAEIKGFL